MSGSALIVGDWREPEAREITHCPSYYAADSETLRVKPGAYPARVHFAGGYTVPMPYWLLVGLDCERVAGRLYSGFGGVNHSHTELPAGEPVRHTLQMYAYSIGEAVRAGRMTLRPGFEWLADASPGRAFWQHPDAPATWERVRDLMATACGCGCAEGGRHE